MSCMIGWAATRRTRRMRSAALSTGATAAVVIAVWIAGAQPAMAAIAPVGLGTATSFAVLAGTTVTNTGPTTVSGDLGVSPGSAVTGFPPGAVMDGTEHIADAVAAQAQADLTTAYNDAEARTPATVVPTDLGGQTLVSGVYTTAAGTVGLTGTVTLDAQGDPNAVFIFQAASTLITASDSTVQLINGAQACNVFWQVGSSATLGTSTTFAGNILALTSISLEATVTVSGRLLARNGAVTLIADTITRPTCITPSASPTTTTPAGSAAPSVTGTAGVLPTTGSSGIVPLSIVGGSLAVLGILLLAVVRYHRLREL